MHVIGFALDGMSGAILGEVAEEQVVAVEMDGRGDRARLPRRYCHPAYIASSI